MTTFNHADINQQTGKIYCQNCPAVFENPDDFLAHVCRVSPMRDPELKECPHCHAFFTPDYYGRHEKHCQKRPLPFTRYCPDCAGWYGAGEHCQCTAARSPEDEFLGAPATLPPEPVRGLILDAAKAHTLGDRNDIHGDPIPMMEKFMDLIEPILVERERLPKAMTGALILDAYKTARVLHNPKHRDSFEDKCAYGAIAGEAASRTDHA